MELAEEGFPALAAKAGSSGSALRAARGDCPTRAMGCEHQGVPLHRVTITQLFTSGPPSPPASLGPSPRTLGALPVCLIQLCSEAEAYGQGRAMGNRSCLAVAGCPARCTQLLSLLDPGSKGQLLSWGRGRNATEGSRQRTAKAIDGCTRSLGRPENAHTCVGESSRALAWPGCAAASKLTPQILRVTLRAGTRRPSAWAGRAASRGRGDYRLPRKSQGAGRGPDPLSLRRQPRHWSPARLGGRGGLTQQLDGA